MDLEYKIKESNIYFNIKQVLREEFLMSDRLIRRLAHSSQIYLNGQTVNIKYSNLIYGDIISVDLNFEEESNNIVPTKMNMNILYEDEYFLIINKSAYMPVHPSLNHFEDSLSNGVKYYFDSINLKRKIRIINRLDKDTSRNSCFCKK